MKLDDVLTDYIGEFGIYQLCLCSLVSMIDFMGGEQYAINFIGDFPEHWCKTEQLLEFPHDHQKYVSIPYTDQTGEEYETCERFALNYSRYEHHEYYYWNRTVMVNESTATEDCSAWVYDQSQYVKTITSEWDLVCGKRWYVSMTSSIYMLGYLFGAVSCGIVSDWVGRRPAIFLYLIVKIIANFMSAFAPEYITFIVARFFIGLGGTGCWLVTYVLTMEVVGSFYRPALGVVFFMANSLAMMAIAGMAYLIRDHIKLQLVLAFPMLLFFLYFFLLPESPRWLMSKGRYEQAHKILRKMALVNQKELPEDLNLENVDEEGQETSKRGTFLDLMKAPKLRVRSFIVDLHWFTDSLMYYALSLNTGYLHGDIYVNTVLMGAVELPANLLCFFALDWKYTGRRWTCGLSLVIAGIANFIMIPLILDGVGTATTVLSLVGKGFVTVGFCGIYVYSSELFPTDVRNVAMGVASMWARVSGMIAPFVGGPLAEVWAPLPSLIFGIFGTLSGILCLFLPETLGQPLFDTVEEAEAFSGKKAKTNSSLNLPAHEKSLETEDTELPVSMIGYNTFDNKQVEPVQDAGYL